MADLPMEHDQYKRYVRGDTPLKWDQIALFAQAYRITVDGLSRALGIADAPSAPADIRAALYALGYREDEAPVVDRVVTKMLELTPKQRRQLLDLMATAVDAPASSN